MAVIVADRKEGKLEVLERISELYDYSSQLCQSEKTIKSLPNRLNIGGI